MVYKKYGISREEIAGKSREKERSNILDREKEHYKERHEVFCHILYYSICTKPNITRNCMGYWGHYLMNEKVKKCSSVCVCVHQFLKLRMDNVPYIYFLYLHIVQGCE